MYVLLSKYELHEIESLLNNIYHHLFFKRKTNLTINDLSSKTTHQNTLIQSHQLSSRIASIIILAFLTFIIKLSFVVLSFQLIPSSGTFHNNFSRPTFFIFVLTENNEF